VKCLANILIIGGFYNRQIDFDFFIRAISYLLTI